MPGPYPMEFRREAVALLKSSGKPVPQLAGELGVSPQSLRNWARPQRPGLAIYVADLHAPLLKRRSTSRWEAAATASTTLSWRASTRRSRRTSSTAAPGRRRRKPGTAVFAYIEAFYNRRRRDSRLGMRSPADFETSTLINHSAGLAASRLATYPQSDSLQQQRHQPPNNPVSTEAGEVQALCVVLSLTRDARR